MEREEKNQRAFSMTKPPEAEFLLQWGKRKRLRCVRIRSSSRPPHLLSHLSSDSSDPSSITRIRRKISSRFLSVANQDKRSPLRQAPCRLTRNSETVAVLRSEKRRGSPEKEESSYTTRWSMSFAGNLEETGKAYRSDGHGHGAVGGDENASNSNNHRGGSIVWPKLYITLSSKEKEEVLAETERIKGHGQRR